MIEKALVKRTSKSFWAWIMFLVALIAVGFAAYIYQMTHGFAVTGLSRDISWGLYIGHLTFFVGVAAGGVMIVLPYYLHNVKEYGRITVVGEFLAIPAIIMALLFVVVDIGSPMKLFNVYIYATPHSMLFWDSVVLPCYLVLNLIVGYNVLQAENKGVKYGKIVKALAVLSIPFAFSIHIVTAFLYSGLPSRHYFLTAMLPAKFLASAFATGPSLIILICFILKKLTGFDAGQKAINNLATTIAYAYTATIFMVLCEFFVAFYSNVPGHKAALQYLFFGLHGHSQFVPLMMFFVCLVVVSLVLLIPRQTRTNPMLLGIACACVFLSMYIEKGLTFVIGGLSETPFGEIAAYHPTVPEVLIIVGVFAIGFLIATILFKLVVVVKKDRDVEAFPQEDRAGLAARYVAEYNAANGIVVEPKVVKVEEPAEESDETKENE
ncbi:MAG: polysulfide reductase NrfD [Peptococcaceae bacterium]|nr:polysulfide reductase NrfD [Peptococcaceae bacterium]